MLDVFNFIIPYVEKKLIKFDFTLKLYIMADSNMKRLEELLANDLTFLGQFIVDPSSALKEQKIELETKEDTRRVEAFAKVAQQQVQLNGKLSGFETSSKAEWGIGMGCCNSKAFITLDPNV